MNDTITRQSLAPATPQIVSRAPARIESVYPRSRLILPLVFVGGLSSIGIEISASRLIAPYFGSSTFIWANLIGLTLTYLALGYYVGGRIADRRPDPRLLFLFTAVAAAFTGLIPILARPILEVSLDAFDQLAVGAFYGSLLGAILLLAVPITLLGFVTPFAIRLQLHDVDGAGRTSGRIYALSTIGSILGSFIPVLVLIPIFGTRASFFVLAGALLAVSIAGLLETRSAGASVLATALALVMISGNVYASDTIKPPYRGELVFEAESEYNYIQVLKDGDAYLLALNEGHAIHSIYNPDQILTGGPWDYFMVAPLFVDGERQKSPSSAMMIGLAGGTAARQMIAAYPGMLVDGVEIDPEVVDAGRRYFGMTDPRINVIVGDGRYVLRTSEKTYDIIGVDAYKQPYIPFQLTTKEFFQELSDHLNECGVAVINVGRTETDFRLVDVIASTMQAVFPAVHAIDVGRYSNTMLVASNCPTSIDAFQVAANDLPEGSIVKTVAGWSLDSGKMRRVESDGQVFTDDHAPVELVVDEMIVDAARDGNDD